MHIVKPESKSPIPYPNRTQILTLFRPSPNKTRLTWDWPETDLWEKEEDSVLYSTLSQTDRKTDRQTHTQSDPLGSLSDPKICIVFVMHSHTNRSLKALGINCKRIYTFNNSYWYWNVSYIKRKVSLTTEPTPTKTLLKEKYLELQSLVLHINVHMELLLAGLWVNFIIWRNEK